MTEKQQQAYDAYLKCREVICNLDGADVMLEATALIAADLAAVLNKHIRHGERLLFEEIKLYMTMPRENEEEISN